MNRPARPDERRPVNVTGLTEEVEIAVEVARYIARRLEHARVDHEHLLAALLVDPEAGRLLSRKGVDGGVLRQIVNVQLASRAPVATYRTADRERPRPTVEEILRRAERGWVWRTVSLESLLEEVCAVPEVGDLLARARRAGVGEGDSGAARRRDEVFVLRPVGMPAEVALGILEEHLGKAPGEAKHLVLRARLYGRASVGVYERAAAQQQALAAWAACGSFTAARLFEVLPGTRLPVSGGVLHHLETALALGEELPIEDGADVLTVDHVVWRLLETGRLARAIAVAGGRREVVRQLLEEYLVEVGSGDYQATLRNAAYVLLNSPITPFHVLEHLPPDSMAACALDEAGVALDVLLRAWTDGVPGDSPPEAAEAAERRKR